jgi:cytosine/adenosine deaminase-related metal-dependent hydrolase
MFPSIQMEGPLTEKNHKSFFVFLFFFLLSLHASAGSLIVFGQIPGQYLSGRDATHFSYGYIKMENRLITEIGPFTWEDLEDLKASADHAIVLTNPETGELDAIYPGLIDLHGHNKQNMLPTWTGAMGRFGNRYEWRRESEEYKTVQRNNMNPWVSAQASEVAAYRWSELQAMVLGTTYLQGTIFNHRDFSIHSIEDNNAFITKRETIQSNGDYIDPSKWSLLWNDLRPLMEAQACSGSFDCYKNAVTEYLTTNCLIEPVPRELVQQEIEKQETQRTAIPEIVIDDVSADLAVNWLLAAKDSLGDMCPQVTDKDPLILFFTDKFGNLPHRVIVRLNRYLDDPNKGAIITHLAEGRRRDPATWVEFQLLKLAGLAREGMNFIHGNALEREDFQHMSQNNMGLVWSPYSNFLLYGETVDIRTALEEDVIVAIGSDWTPTGSKGVLEELRVAIDYLEKENIPYTDELLYKMVTENAAKIMNHYGYEGSGEHGVGTLEVNAMGTLIATRVEHQNPFTNLVRHVQAQDINLVVIDGKPIYGNRTYIEDYKTDMSYEVISGKIFDLTLESHPESFPNTMEPLLRSKKINRNDMGITIAQYASRVELGSSTQCGFVEPKVFVNKKSRQWRRGRVESIFGDTSLNLDTYSGITRYIGVALLSQSRNVTHRSGSTTYQEGAVRFMPPLYSCEDPGYTDYLLGMASGDNNRIVYMQSHREELRLDQGFYTHFDNESRSVQYTVPHQMALLYRLVDPVAVPLRTKIVDVTIQD